MSTPPFLPFGRQTIEADDLAAVAEALHSDWLTTGPRVKAFEAALAHQVGAAHAISCASGTAALHLALLALGVGPGDGVIVPAVTFLATANAVRLVGAEVVFADVEPDTGLMGVPQLEEAFAQAYRRGWRVRVVIPVHLNGQCREPAALQAVAARHGALVIEDGCQALGAAYLDGIETVAVGSCRHAELTVFSFHPTKSITTGEGGAVTTNDPGLNQRLMRLRAHGIVYDPAEFTQPEQALEADGERRPWYYEMPAVGYNYRLSDIQCALGLSQLAKLERLVAARRRLADRYAEALADLAPMLRPVTRIPGCRSAWHLCVVLIDFARVGVHRTGFMQKLRENGVGSQVHYLPLPWHPYYRGRYGEAAIPGAAAYYDRCLSIPLYPTLTEVEQERVIQALHGLLAG